MGENMTRSHFLHLTDALIKSVHVLHVVRKIESSKNIAVCVYMIKATMHTGTGVRGNERERESVSHIRVE